MKYCPKCEKIYAETQRFCLDDGESLLFQDPYHLTNRTLNDKYRIGPLVGSGGFGVVYSAHQIGVERNVAFKILKPDLAISNARVRELFEREAKIAGSLNHPNIVSVYDAGRAIVHYSDSDSKEFAYIVMEWLEGRTLESELSVFSQFSFEQIASILRQVTDALEEAHTIMQIIHRDLKPANVMLIKKGSNREMVKVLDFGLAKVLSDPAGSLVSAPMGTPHYASPEQFQKGHHIDSRSDIYSLGVILYQILTGELPFNATDLKMLIRLQLTATPKPIRDLRPNAPLEVEELVYRMLASDPAQRPQHANEIYTLFDSAISKLDKSQLRKAKKRDLSDNISEASTISKQKNCLASIDTDKGTIEFTLYVQEVPSTTRNFIELAELGFYNGLTFHRVIPRYIIQSGDPKGDGTGGSDKTIKFEINTNLKHDRPGAVAMAHGVEPDSGSSQFYITLVPAPELDGDYAIFGHVIRGMDVVEKIKVGDKIISLRISY